MTASWNFGVLVFVIIPLLGIMFVWLQAIRINTRNTTEALWDIRRVLERGVDANIASLRRQGLLREAENLEQSKHAISDQ